MIRILSIDGGGIRGILPGQMLVALEAKLRAKSGNDKARVADYFDLVAGTSTGGILTCALLAPDVIDPSRAKMTAQEAVDLYLKQGATIFKKTARKKFTSVFGLADEIYDEKNIESVLNSVFGDSMLSGLLKPCLITSYDIFRRQAHFFTKHDAQVNPAYDYKVTDVCRSTSAAPTYFEVSKTVSKTGVEYPLIDGGVFVNNPALCAYAEARTLFNGENGKEKCTATDMFILSMGTGSQKKPYEYKKAKDWGKVEWISPLIDIMMSGVSETVDYQLRQLFDAAGCPQQYIRLSPTLGDADTAMDDASEENLHSLKVAGIESGEKFAGELDRAVDILLKSQPAEMRQVEQPAIT